MKANWLELVDAKALLLAILIFWSGEYLLPKIAKAQTVPTTLQLTGSAPHTTCAVVPSTTNFCFANDGLWQSINGAPYVQLTPALTGGVTSVNGKTGAVVITATTNSTTTIQ